MAGRGGRLGQPALGLACTVASGSRPVPEPRSQVSITASARKVSGSRRRARSHGGRGRAWTRRPQPPSGRRGEQSPARSRPPLSGASLGRRPVRLARKEPQSPHKVCGHRCAHVSPLSISGVPGRGAAQASRGHRQGAPGFRQPARVPPGPPTPGLAAALPNGVSVKAPEVELGLSGEGPPRSPCAALFSPHGACPALAGVSSPLVDAGVG